MSVYPEASRRTSIYIAPLLIPALAIGAAALLLTAAPVQSSAGDEPYCRPSDRSIGQAFHKSKAVMIGRLIKRSRERPFGFRVLTYRVERVYKEGNGRSSVGRTVKVGDWAPCFPDERGRSYGLFLDSPSGNLWSPRRYVSSARLRMVAERRGW